jgi:hypothetical protein
MVRNFEISSFRLRDVAFAQHGARARESEQTLIRCRLSMSRPSKLGQSLQKSTHSSCASSRFILSPKLYPSTYAQKVDIFGDKLRIAARLPPPPHTLWRKSLAGRTIAGPLFAAGSIFDDLKRRTRKFFPAKSKPGTPLKKSAIARGEIFPFFSPLARQCPFSFPRRSSSPLDSI